MLLSRGFGSKWMEWVMSTIHQGTFQVRINDSNGPQFSGGKGLKQGDPHSPLLFNLVADVFSKMLHKATNSGLIYGLLPQAFPGGMISLQYADDTILFLDNSLDYARNLKWIL